MDENRSNPKPNKAELSVRSADRSNVGYMYTYISLTSSSSKLIKQTALFYGFAKFPHDTLVMVNKSRVKMKWLGFFEEKSRVVFFR